MNQATGGSVGHADIRLFRQPLLAAPGGGSATPKCRVQLRINKPLDEPTNPIPDGSLDRIEPTSAEESRRCRRTVAAMLLDGVISLGVSPPSLARCTSRRSHHREVHHFCDPPSNPLTVMVRGHGLAAVLAIVAAMGCEDVDAPGGANARFRSLQVGAKGTGSAQ
jgi:hypothetical protein